MLIIFWTLFFSAHTFSATPSSFREYLQLMLEKNNQYLGAFLNEEAAAERERGNIGLYMPKLTGSFSRDKTYQKSTFAKSGVDTTSAGLAGRIPELGLDYSSTVYNDVETFEPPPSTYSGSFNYTLTLNLLKDFGPLMGRLPFKEAEINHDIAYYDRVSTVYELFGTLLSGYSTAIAAQKNYLLTKDSERRTIDELKKSEELFKAGRIPKLSLLALEGQAGQIKVQTMVQERQMMESFKQLFLISSLESDIPIELNKVALEPMPPLFDQSVIEDLIKNEFTLDSIKNPAYLKGKLSLEQSRIALTRAKNAVWPSLDLSYTYSTSKSGFEKASPFMPKDLAGETVALNFAVPLGLFSERKELSATKMSYQVAELNFSQLKKELLREWDNLVFQYKLLKEQKTQSQKFVKIAKEKYEASLPTASLGSTYQQNVISFQNEWVNAQVALNQLEIELALTEIKVLSFHADKHLFQVINRLK